MKEMRCGRLTITFVTLIQHKTKNESVQNEMILATNFANK